MPEYTVVAADKKSDKPDKGYGPMQVIALTLRDEMDQTKDAEWYTRANTILPVVGAKLHGDLKPSKFGGLDFKKEANLNGGKGGYYKPKDPAEIAAIQRQSSQRTAVLYLQAAATAGALTAENFPTVGQVGKWVDFFERDIENNAKPAKPYGQEQRKEPVRTGGTDAPADAEQFVHPVGDLEGTPFGVQS